MPQTFEKHAIEVCKCAIYRNLKHGIGDVCIQSTTAQEIVILAGKIHRSVQNVLYKFEKPLIVIKKCAIEL